MCVYMLVTWGNYDLTYITTEMMSDAVVLSSSALGLAVGHMLYSLGCMRLYVLCLPPPSLCSCMKELIMYSSIGNILMQVPCTFMVDVEEWVSPKLCLLILELSVILNSLYNINIPPRLYK